MADECGALEQVDTSFVDNKGQYIFEYPKTITRERMREKNIRTGTTESLPILVINTLCYTELKFVLQLFKYIVT